MTRGVFDGASSHPLYRTWTAMRYRCSNPNYPSYPYYGGRGITVCEEWENSFWSFVNDVGPRPAGVSPAGRSLYSIDRIDVDGNYEPGNVRWATHSEQMLNVRQRTHCSRGHEFPPVEVGKVRRCRICQYESIDRYRARLRAEKQQ